MKYLLTVLSLIILLLSINCTTDSGLYPVVMTVESDKSEYTESDTVFFRIYIANYGPSVVKMITYQTPAYDVFVYTNNQEIWHWMWGRGAWLDVTTFYIPSGDTLIFGEENEIYWTQMDYDTAIVSRGTYTAEADIVTDCKMQSIQCSFELK